MAFTKQRAAATTDTIRSPRRNKVFMLFLLEKLQVRGDLKMIYTETPWFVNASLHLGLLPVPGAEVEFFATVS